ncbi:MAG: 50S ribosomal protein L35 [Alphaproteobacteria bacterium]|nr:50S ribosomal protein L35 [Alphaproteobacteria bacterium]
MPKMKTNKGAKKRFRLTATGKVVRSFANKQHNMRKRSNRMLRQARGTTVMAECDARIVRHHLPYA